MVIKKKNRKQVTVNPEYILKKVTISLSVCIIAVQGRCRPYVSIILKGWNAWVERVTSGGGFTQRKRDWVAKVLGGIGTGPAIKNVVDAESLVMKISNTGHDVTSLEQALMSSLSKIASLEYQITKILPEWVIAQQGNDRTFLGGLSKLMGSGLPARSDLVVYLN